MLQDLFPVWRVVISAQVGLQFATEDLQGGALANTVGSDQTQDLARAGHGQSVQLETVCRITVSDLGFQIGWQIDDVYGTKWTFFRADTTSDAKAFRDVGDLGLGRDLDTEFASSDDGAGFLAFLSTFLDMVSVSGCAVGLCGLLTFGLHCGAGNQWLTIVLCWVSRAGD